MTYLGFGDFMGVELTASCGWYLNQGRYLGIRVCGGVQTVSVSLGTLLGLGACMSDLLTLLPTISLSFLTSLRCPEPFQREGETGLTPTGKDTDVLSAGLPFDVADGKEWSDVFNGGFFPG